MLHSPAIAVAIPAASCSCGVRPGSPAMLAAARCSASSRVSPAECSSKSALALATTARSAVWAGRMLPVTAPVSAILALRSFVRARRPLAASCCKSGPRPVPSAPCRMAAASSRMAAPSRNNLRRRTTSSARARASVSESTAGRTGTRLRWSAEGGLGGLRTRADAADSGLSDWRRGAVPSRRKGLSLSFVALASGLPADSDPSSALRTYSSASASPRRQ